jgi:hypothetical protein
MKMKTDEMFQSNYIKAEVDLMKKVKGKLRPKDLDVTIVGCTSEEFQGDEGELTQKYILYFEETPKGLVLNKTNFKALMKVHPVDDTDEWIGEQITLFAQEVSFRGDMVWGTRIRLAPPGELEYEDAD